MGEGDEGTLFIVNKERQSLICYDALDFLKNHGSMSDLSSVASYCDFLKCGGK